MYFIMNMFVENGDKTKYIRMIILKPTWVRSD